MYYKLKLCAIYIKDEISFLFVELKITLTYLTSKLMFIILHTFSLIKSLFS